MPGFILFCESKKYDVFIFALNQGQGPDGWNDFANTEEIGTRQAVFAQQLWANATTLLSTGNFGYVHTYVDMSNVTGECLGACPCFLSMDNQLLLSLPFLGRKSTRVLEVSEMRLLQGPPTDLEHSTLFKVAPEERKC